MKTILLPVTVIFLAVFLFSCSKKTQPTATTAATAPAETRTAVKRPLITTVPKVISVNDKAAKRSLDGRYYYDLNGHRYWRNNRDGKYYLFHKSMFDNKDFKSPGN